MPDFTIKTYIRLLEALKTAWCKPELAKHMLQMDEAVESLMNNLGI